MMRETNSRLSVHLCNKGELIVSDYIVKIISSDPYFCITDQKSQTITQRIKKNIKADLVEVHMQEKPHILSSPYRTP